MLRLPPVRGHHPRPRWHVEGTLPLSLQYVGFDIDLVTSVSPPTSHPVCCVCPKARSGKLEESELETFKKQAQCLQFLPEFYLMGPGQLSLQNPRTSFINWITRSCFFHCCPVSFFFQIICVQMTETLPLRTQRRNRNLPPSEDPRPTRRSSTLTPALSNMN